MMKVFSWSLALVLLFVFSFLVWQNIPFPCKDPIRYSLGTFDARFGLTEEEFLAEVATAEKVWEDVLGKDLFSFAEDAPFKINLVFDERQAQTIEGKKLAESLDKAKAAQQTLTEKNKAALGAYDAALMEYEALLVSFKTRLKEYNEEVDVWNKKGGATREAYEKLGEESKTLENSQNTLEAKREKVNGLANTVNRFSKEQVQVVDKYNDQVDGYVKLYGEPRNFDQGDYIQTTINIYQFDDASHLRLVLAHELGHALGIGHVEGPISIMYPIMGGQDITLLRATSIDESALRESCDPSLHRILQRLASRYKFGAEEESKGNE